VCHGLTHPSGSQQDLETIEIGELRHLLSSKYHPGTPSVTVHLKELMFYVHCPM